MFRYLCFILTATTVVVGNPIDICIIDGGASNKNFLLNVEDRSFFIRIGCQGTSATFNEFKCCKIAAEHEIAPMIYHFYSPRNILISQYLTPEFKSDPRDTKTLNLITKTLRKLHSLKTSFPSVVNPFEIIYAYSAEIALIKPNPVITDILIPKIQKIEKQIKLRTFTPCHLDLHQGNIIVNNDQAWLIDWEFASMSDPLFDLATLAATERFTNEEMRNLLSSYDPNYTPKDWDHFYAMRILADSRWALWSWIQMHTSTIDYAFDRDYNSFLETALKRKLYEKSGF